MRHILLLSFLLLASTAAGTALADEPGAADPTDTRLSATARLEALIRRVKEEQQKLHSFEAQFTRRQESEMLLEPEVASGVVSYVAPDKVRWEYRAPNPLSVVIRGEEMTTWYRDLGQAEKARIGRYSDRVFKYLGASASMEMLMEYFDAAVQFPEADSGEPYRLELTPRYERIARRLRSMTVWIDSRRFLPSAFRYVDAGGDVTEYRLTQFESNPQIPGDRFELDLPASVEVRWVDLDLSSR